MAGYVLKGKSHWAKLYQHNASEGKFSIDLELLDKKDIEFCKGLGLKVKTATEEGDKRGTFVSFWGYASLPDGSPKEMKVVDASLNKTDVLIGNGSIVNVSFYPKAWEYQKKKGVKGVLTGVQIVDLIPYGGASFEKVEGGFTSNPTKSSVKEEPQEEEVQSFKAYKIDDEIPF